MNPADDKIFGVSKNKLALAALSLTIAAAAAVRLAGIKFGLPHTEARPDESTVIFISLRSLLFDAAPASFVYPTFYTYLLSFIYRTYAIITAVPLQSLMNDYLVRPDTLFIINRVLACLFGIATVVPVYLTAKTIGGRKAGLAAAICMAFCFLHVRDSHFGVLDVPMTFFISMSAFFLSRRGESARHWLAAGLFAGLAMGTKYAGVLMAVPAAAACLFRLKNERIPLVKIFSDKRLWVFSGALAAAFLLTTPYAILHPHDFLEGYQYHKNLHGVMHGATWAEHLKVSLGAGVTWPLLAAGMTGLVAMAVRIPALSAGLWVFTLVYFAVISKVSSTYVRYAIPLLPFLCVGAGYLCSLLADKAANIKLKTAVYAGILALLVLTGAARSWQFDSILEKEDTRTLAAGWIEKNIPAGNSIAPVSTVYGTPPIRWDGEFTSVRAAQMRAENNTFKETLYNELEREYSASPDKRFRKIERKEGNFLTVSGVEAEPDWIIAENSPLTKFNSDITVTQNRYGLAASFESHSNDCRSAVFDRMDAFYVPISGISCFSRPGPNIYIYKRNTDAKQA